MRVGFTGTGGTGKTTTAMLCKDWLGLEYHESVPRQVMKERGITESDQIRMSSHDKWDLQKAILRRKIEQDTAIENGLFDRTLIDHFAYCLYRCGDVITDREFTKVWADVWEGMKKYDFVIYFPMFDWPASANDGFRQASLAYRKAIDSIMLGLLQQSGGRYGIIPDGNPAERAKMVIDLVTLGDGFAPQGVG